MGLGSLQRLPAYLRWRISGKGLLGFVHDSFCVLGYCSGEYFLPNTVVFLGEPGEAVGVAFCLQALPMVPQLWDSKYLLSQERDNLTPSLSI